MVMYHTRGANDEKMTTHYENMPMQYLGIFHGCNNDYFHMKNCDIFLIFAQNIDCGYMIPQSMF